MMAANDAIDILDDGDAAPSSGTGGSTHTYNSLTSTGPSTFALISYTDNASINSASWGVNSGSILVQVGVEDAGTAIVYWDGAQTGNLVISFADDISDSHVTIVSLTNLRSGTAVDTSSKAKSSGSVDMKEGEATALTTPGVGGIRLAVYTTEKDSTEGSSWTGATGLSDVDAGGHQHAAGYDKGDNGATISFGNNDANAKAIAGVSMR
jgi:hypothetical protein